MSDQYNPNNPGVYPPPKELVNKVRKEMDRGIEEDIPGSLERLQEEARQEVEREDKEIKVQTFKPIKKRDRILISIGIYGLAVGTIMGFLAYSYAHIPNFKKSIDSIFQSSKTKLERKVDNFNSSFMVVSEGNTVKVTPTARDLEGNIIKEWKYQNPQTGK